MSGDTVWSDVDWVVLDLEGNGAQPPELVELALVHITGGQIREPVWWLVRPPSPIRWQARKVHGITDKDVAGRPAFAEVAAEVHSALAGAFPVGHNVRVDLDVMGRELPEWSPAEAIDTLRMARLVWPPPHGLTALVERRGLASGMPPGLRPHRAAYDALVTARLFVDLVADSGARTVADVRRHAGLALAEPEPVALF